MTNPFSALDKTGLDPILLATIVEVGAALINLIRSGANDIARKEALMTIAEAAKAALDRDKFPGQDL
jgi:hypothetical protein